MSGFPVGGSEFAQAETFAYQWQSVSFLAEPVQKRFPGEGDFKFVMETLPFEILQCIFEYLVDMRDGLTLLSLNRNFRRIGDQEGIIRGLNAPFNMTDQILNQKKYHNLNSLDLSFNFEISSVNHLTKLRTLILSMMSEVSQEGIMQCTKLRRLTLDSNSNITSVNHLTELEELDASGVTCRLSQEGIMGCRKLKKLDLTNNPGITSVNHLTELEELRISGEICQVSQKGIMDCRRFFKWLSEVIEA